MELLKFMFASREAGLVSLIIIFILCRTLIVLANMFVEARTVNKILAEEKLKRELKANKDRILRT